MDGKFLSLPLFCSSFQIHKADSFEVNFNKFRQCTRTVRELHSLRTSVLKEGPYKEMCFWWSVLVGITCIIFPWPLSPLPRLTPHCLPSPCLCPYAFSLLHLFRYKLSVTFPLFPNWPICSCHSLFGCFSSYHSHLLRAWLVLSPLYTAIFDGFHCLQRKKASCVSTDTQDFLQSAFLDPLHLPFSSHKGC